MAVYKIFVSKDATIYSGYPYMNTGLDEILETSTNFYINNPQEIGGVPQVSRYLIKFDQAEIENVINNLVVSSWQANLKVYQAKIYGLYDTTTIAVNALSQDWNMGSGRAFLIPEATNGVSWKSSAYSGSTEWPTSSFSPGTTGSYNLITNPSSAGGGVWYTGSQASQSFEYYSSLDLNVNVTSIVTNWYSSSFNNYGFIVRQTESQEFINDINRQVEMKYFSTDTNTIYPPVLEFKWNDYVFNTGSSTNTILYTPDAFISLGNNVGVYYPESINKFRINASPKYPARVFITSSLYTTNYYLPENVSLYAVKDTETNEYIVDFDPVYTRISADTTSSYFKVFMNGLQPERNYTILVQTVIDGSTIVFDENIIFKVVNG